MKRVGRLAGKWWLFYPVLASYVVLWALPGSVWFESRTIAISDAEVGMAPVVVEGRTIHFSFLGAYTTTTRDVLTGNVAGGCSGSADVRYRGGLDGVNTTNLVDWTDGKQSCAMLPAGQYVTETCRAVTAPAFGWAVLPPKWQCWTSNIFTIFDPQQQEQKPRGLVVPQEAP